MIFTTISKLSNYIPLIPNLEKVCKELEKASLMTLDEGRYDLLGDDVFYMINLYKSSCENDKNYEYHKKYIDVQVMLSGQELCLWSKDETSLNKEDFLEKDISFKRIKKEDAKLILSSHDVAIFFPGELHKPGLDYNYREINRKIVFKIKY